MWFNFWPPISKFKILQPCSMYQVLFLKILQKGITIKIFDKPRFFSLNEFIDKPSFFVSSCSNNLNAAWTTSPAEENFPVCSYSRLNGSNLFKPSKNNKDCSIFLTQYSHSCFGEMQMNHLPHKSLSIFNHNEIYIEWLYIFG